MARLQLNEGIRQSIISVFSAHFQELEITNWLNCETVWDDMTFGLESIEFGVSFRLPIIPKSNWGNVSGETRNCVRVNPGSDGLYCSEGLKMNALLMLLTDFKTFYSCCLSSIW